jgi:hypothetical protein
MSGRIVAPAAGVGLWLVGPREIQSPLWGSTAFFLQPVAYATG